MVLLHGSNESARSYTQLALALAGAFTVYLPDRRGRGLSGPHRPDHSMRTEVEDLQAARTTRAIRQVAAYEPALLMDTSAGTPGGWIASARRSPAARWPTR